MHDIELILRLRLTPADAIPFYLLYFFLSFFSFSFSFTFYLLISSYSCIVLSAGSRTPIGKITCIYRSYPEHLFPPNNWKGVTCRVTALLLVLLAPRGGVLQTRTDA